MSCGTTASLPANADRSALPTPSAGCGRPTTQPCAEFLAAVIAYILLIALKNDRLGYLLLGGLPEVAKESSTVT